jgi:hypothetical protein
MYGAIVLQMAIYADYAMSTAERNYFLKTEPEDALVFAIPVPIILICITCNDTMEGKLHDGWGPAEHFNGKSIQTSWLAVTHCCECRVSETGMFVGRHKQSEKVHNINRQRLMELDIYKKIKELHKHPIEVTTREKGENATVTSIPSSILVELNDPRYEMVCILSKDTERVGQKHDRFFK